MIDLGHMQDNIFSERLTVWWALELHGELSNTVMDQFNLPVAHHPVTAESLVEACTARQSAHSEPTAQRTAS